MSSTKTPRRIVVSDTTFHWKADWEYVRDTRVIKLRVWQPGDRGQTLRVNLTTKAPISFDDAYVLPKDVQIVIEYALAHGWQPQVRGADHWLTHNDPMELDALQSIGGTDR